MAIKDLDKYHALIQEWDDIVNHAAQADFWVKDMLTRISVLQLDPNFAPNASQEETNYLLDWITVLNKFVSTEPINPDL